MSSVTNNYIGTDDTGNFVAPCTMLRGIHILGAGGFIVTGNVVVATTAIEVYGVMTPENGPFCNYLHSTQKDNNTISYNFIGANRM